MKYLALVCVLGLCVSGTWLARDLVTEKGQSFHVKAVASCVPQMNTIPYQLRGFFLRFRPEQKV